MRVGEPVAAFALVLLGHSRTRVEYRVLKEKEPSIPSNVVVAYEAKANGAGQRSVLLMDGSVVGVPESQLTGFRPMPDDRILLLGSTLKT